MPSPPFVIASSAPCEAVIKKKSTTLSDFLQPTSAEPTSRQMPATTANKIEWRHPAMSPQIPYRTPNPNPITSTSGSAEQPTPLPKIAIAPQSRSSRLSQRSPNQKMLSEYSASSSVKSSVHHQHQHMPRQKFRARQIRDGLRHILRRPRFLSGANFTIPAPTLADRPAS